MSAQRLGPSRLWYWPAGAVLVGSVVWIAVNLVLGLGSAGRQIDAYQRVPLPGQGEVSFTQPGRYVLFYEGPGASEDNVPAFTASLTPVGRGEQVPLVVSGGSTAYDLSGHSGRSVGSFQVKHPGRFLLRVDGDVQAANVAVGRSIGPAIVRTVLLVVLGGAVLFLGGTALLVVVAVGRARTRRRLRASDPSRSHGTPVTPPGWFADPSMRHQLRFWDGQRWSEHVLDDGMSAIDHLPQPAARDPQPR